MNSSVRQEAPALVIRVHLTDESIESFSISDKRKAEETWSRIEPKRLFAQPRLVIAGEHSKSVFICSEIVRIDFIQECFGCWEFSEGYSDVIELSEANFRKHIRVDQPELMPRREQSTPVGDLLVSFLKLGFRHILPIHLMAEFSVRLPIENQSFLRFALSKSSFHMRLVDGGVGLLNLANLIGYTAYPGVPQIPADSWIAEPVTSGLNQSGFAETRNINR